MLKLGTAVLAFSSSLMLGACSSSLVLASERCEYSSEQQLTLNDIQRLQVTMGSDHLTLVGGTDDQVNVTARLCASTQKRLKQMVLEPEQQGEVAQLRLLPERRSNSFSVGLFGRKNEKYSRFELTIAVPTTMLLDLTVSSGFASIENIAGLDLTLSSGRVQASHISGPVSSTVSSGQLTLADTGPVQLNALSSGRVTLQHVESARAFSIGSGRLRIEQVIGDVHVSSLGSGQVHAHDVQTSLSVDLIGSGSVRVSDVAGNVAFGSLGSGSIRAERIGGDLSLERKGSGSIRHQDVNGQVRLPGR